MGLYHGYGKVVKEYKTIKPNRNMCGGCYCAPYWHGLGGSNKCWYFDDAKVVDKLAYPNIHCNDSQVRKYKKTLSCYHSVNKEKP